MYTNCFSLLPSLKKKIDSATSTYSSIQTTRSITPRDPKHYLKTIPTLPTRKLIQTNWLREDRRLAKSMIFRSGIRGKIMNGRSENVMESATTTSFKAQEKIKNCLSNNCRRSQQWMMRSRESETRQNCSILDSLKWLKGEMRDENVEETELGFFLVFFFLKCNIAKVKMRIFEI